MHMCEWLVVTNGPIIVEITKSWSCHKTMYLHDHHPCLCTRPYCSDQSWVLRTCYKVHFSCSPSLGHGLLAHCHLVVMCTCLKARVLHTIMLCPYSTLWHSLMITSAALLVYGLVVLFTSHIQYFQLWRFIHELYILTVCPLPAWWWLAAWLSMCEHVILSYILWHILKHYSTHMHARVCTWPDLTDTSFKILLEKT